MGMVAHNYISEHGKMRQEDCKSEARTRLHSETLLQTRRKGSGEERREEKEEIEKGNEVPVHHHSIKPISIQAIISGMIFHYLTGVEKEKEEDFLASNCW